ncbi:MAG: hypothetical protein ACLT98_01730, partial [Eggerthellaceae bacterium]
IKKNTGARRMVMVAGRLSRAEAIMNMLAAQGDGFIMHRPLETAVEDMRHWIVDDQGYTTSRSGNYRIKSRVRTAAVEALDVPDGKEREHIAKHVRVRDIVFWGAITRCVGARPNRSRNGHLGRIRVHRISELNLTAPEVCHL